jgi:hypothetical protein
VVRLVLAARPIACAGCEPAEPASSAVSSGSALSSELSFAPMPLKKDGRGAAVSVSSVVLAAAVVRCVIPKYHLISPISSTPPAVPSISGNRSMSG